MHALPEPEAPDEQQAAPLFSDGPAWWAQARCNDGAATMSELFFSEDLLDIARAKAICSNCAVREACLDEALTRREPWGVWGGELLVNGRILPPERPGIGAELRSDVVTRPGVEQRWSRLERDSPGPPQRSRSEQFVTRVDESRS